MRRTCETPPGLVPAGLVCSCHSCGMNSALKGSFLELCASDNRTEGKGKQYALNTFVRLHIGRGGEGRGDTVKATWLISLPCPCMRVLLQCICNVSCSYVTGI